MFFLERKRRKVEPEDFVRLRVTCVPTVFEHIFDRKRQANPPAFDTFFCACPGSAIL